MSPLITTDYLSEQIAGYVTTHQGAASSGPLFGAQAGLYTNAVAPTPQTTLASLTQPTYTGYAVSNITWSAAQRDGLGLIGCITNLISFAGTGAFPATITGIFVQDSTATHLLALQNFPTPITLNDAFDAINLVIEWLASNPLGMNIDISV